MKGNSFLGAEYYCEACGGWGVTPVFSSNRCTKCNGLGIWARNGNVIVGLKLPMMVDFEKREEIKTREWIALVVGAGVLVVLVAIIWSISYALG